MDIIYILFWLLIIGAILLGINKYAPIDPKIKTIINWVVVIAVILWIVRGTGLLDNRPMIYLHR
jgi:hypothetical protein